MERIKINDGSKSYEIVNQDDKVLGIFTFNPSDANIVARYDAVVDRLDKYLEEVQDAGFDKDRFVAVQNELVQAMDELTASDTKNTFFSICGALTPMVNGSLYIETILTAIGGIIEKETTKRMKKVQTRMDKYLEGYKKK